MVNGIVFITHFCDCHICMCTQSIVAVSAFVRYHISLAHEMGMRKACLLRSTCPVGGVCVSEFLLFDLSVQNTYWTYWEKFRLEFVIHFGATTHDTYAG